MKFVWRRSLALAFAGLIGAIVAAVAWPSTSTATLCLLCAGTAIGELLLLRSDNRIGIPLSYSVFIVLAANFDWRASISVGLCAFVAAAALRENPAQGTQHQMAARHAIVGGAALVAFRSAHELIGGRERLSLLLGILVITVVVMIAVDEFVRARTAIVSGLHDRGRRAWTAIASSGALMAIGERGVAGIGHLGVWGPILFAIPLVAAWYSFERLDAAHRAFEQTIEALAMAPEFAGLAPVGHSQRVAALALAIGAELDLSATTLERLEIAARLHHLGAVTLDDPSLGGPPTPAATVAHVTADMLRGMESLAAAGDIVARAGSKRSFTFLDARGNAAALALQYANAYDEAVADRGANSRVAVRSLRIAAGECDAVERSVIDALERVTRRELMADSR